MTLDTDSDPVTQRHLLKKYPLPSFFVLSYLFFVVAIALIGAVVSLTAVSDLVMGVLIAIASWTPNLAAMVITGSISGKAGVRRLFDGWFRQVSLWWVLFGLSPILIAFISAGVYTALGNSSGPGVRSELTLSAFALMVLFHTIQGATGEELGWRGFALPRLQQRFTPLASALILGLLVSGWHGLLHLVSPTGIPEWQFWMLMVSYTVIITWAYNKSRGSVLIATIFHFAFNFSLEFVTTGLGLIALETLFEIRTAIYAVVAVGLILVTGKHLSK